MTELGKSIIECLEYAIFDTRLRQQSGDAWMEVRMEEKSLNHRITRNTITLFKAVMGKNIVITNDAKGRTFIVQTGKPENYKGREFQVPLWIKTEEELFQYLLIDDIPFELDDLREIARLVKICMIEQQAFLDLTAKRT